MTPEVKESLPSDYVIYEFHLTDILGTKQRFRAVFSKGKIHSIENEEGQIISDIELDMYKQYETNSLSVIYSPKAIHELWKTYS